MHFVREIRVQRVKCAAAREGFISFHIAERYFTLPQGNISLFLSKPQLSYHHAVRRVYHQQRLRRCCISSRVSVYSCGLMKKAPASASAFSFTYLPYQHSISLLSFVRTMETDITGAAPKASVLPNTRYSPPKSL